MLSQHKSLLSLSLDIFSLILKQGTKGEKGLSKMLAKQNQVRLVKIDDISILIYVGLLGTFDAITEDNSIFSLNKHPGTVLFVVFIPKAARVQSEHV